MSTNSDKLPRLADMLVSRHPVRMSRRRRALVTQDGNTIARDNDMPASCRGESYPIAGEPIAMDARPKLSGVPVTFDGAIPDARK